MTMTNDAQASTKVVEKIKKLLALSKDSGATEAEASLAASKAAELMDEWGLTTLAVESAGGEGEGREKNAFKAGRSHWKRTLMRAVAESFYCHFDAMAWRGVHLIEFRLIGRKSAVASALVTFQYLEQATLRSFRESKAETRSLFLDGFAERVAERLRERHARKLREQRAEAERKTREAAARSPSSTSTALTLTLVDYESQERDLNYDHRMGWAPGTTRQRRLEREETERQKNAVMDHLRANGVSDGIAFNMAHLGMSKERAEEYEREWTRKQSRSRSSWTRADEEAWERTQRREARRRSSSFVAGRQAGEKIGLDTQVGGNNGNSKLLK
jgi:hypothetical protein